MRQWLEHNTEPQDKVKDFMKQTAAKRQASIHTGKQTVNEIVATWPRLIESTEMVCKVT